jgi:predicted nucleic acid-binding protein
VNLYLDASALVKNYIDEPGSDRVRLAISRANMAGTHLISRAEVAGALAKAVRLNVLRPDDAMACLLRFRRDWPSLIRLGVSELLIAHADALAWNHGLRGYDAVHLAAASLWQETLGSPVTFAAFDAKLWSTAGEMGLLQYPDDLRSHV